MFYLINFIHFCRYMFMLWKLTLATCFKQVGRGATTEWDSCGMLQKLMKFCQEDYLFIYLPPCSLHSPDYGCCFMFSLSI